jgi:uncharacterized protein (TIGR03663 family)
VHSTPPQARYVIPGPRRATVETGLWILVAVFALGLRLARLDVAPLSAHEAHEAMLVWQAVTGQGMPEADYSPFLFGANALLFALCGASDTLARLWPALFGSALTLTPYLLRRRIGRMGALVAGLSLALSPTALFASRQLDGTVIASLGGMVLLGGLVCFVDTGKHSWLTFSAVGLALAVTASPSVFGLLLTLGLAWLGLAWAWPDGGGTRHLLEGLLRWHLRRVLVVFLLSVLLFSTGLGWNLGGLGAVGDLLSGWIGRFGRVSDPTASPLTLVVVYELLVLLFGIGGLVWAVRRGHRFGVLLGLWAGLGTLLLLLMPGRAPLDTLGVVLPLALLTGVVVELLIRSLRVRRAWPTEWLYALVVLALWVHLYLRLARYAQYADSLDLILAGMTLVLQAVLAMVFVLAMGADLMVRGFAVGTGILLLAVVVSVGWGVAYVRPADVRELLVREPTAVEVHDLVQTMRDLSWRRTGMPTMLPFTLEAAPDSVLAWYLRDFSAARRVGDLEDLDIDGQVLVTSRRDWMPAGDAEYAGQDFTLHRSWNPGEIRCVRPPAQPSLGFQAQQRLQCDAVFEWLLFRDASTSPVPDQSAVLWLHQSPLEG